MAVAMKTNQAMAGVIAGIEGHPLPALPDELERHYGSGVVVQDGLVLLRANRGGTVGADRTAKGWNASSAHLDGYSEDETWPLLLGRGLAIADLLREQLVGARVAGDVGVVLSLNTVDGTSTPTAVLGFHQLRADERPWLGEDLEGFSEPVLTVDLPRSEAGH